jgi:general secretion pathway protein G
MKSNQFQWSCFATGGACGVIATIVVLLIIGFLPESKRTRNARRHASLCAMESLATGLTIYEKECGALPSETQGLYALTRNPGAPHWDGPYVRPLPLDGWGNSFGYRLERDEAVLSSSGEDGKFGTEDDITLDTEHPARP